MKQIILIFTMLALASIIFAQPTGNDKRLETDLRLLNNRFESIERAKKAVRNKNWEIRYKRAVKSAENALERFKKKHPNYDTSKYEQALVVYKYPQDSSESDKTKTNPRTSTSFSKVEDFVALVEEILDLQPPVREFLREDAKATELANSQLDAFRKKMDSTINDELKAIAKDTSNRSIKRISAKAIRGAERIENELNSTNLKRIEDESNPNLMLMRYFKVVFAKEKLATLQKIFDAAEISKANKTADEVVAKLGTLEDIEEKSKANYAEKVARVRLYPERQNNQALKKRFINAFRGSPFTQRDFAKGKILKVHLVSSGWSVERNKLTGIILSRDQQAQFALKKDGKCYSYMVLFKQKYQGGGKYGGVYMRSGSSQEMLCSNVPK